MAEEADWRVNSPGVIVDVLGGEAIIANLDFCDCCTMTGVGAEVWSLAAAVAFSGTAHLLLDLIHEVGAEG